MAAMVALGSSRYPAHTPGLRARSTPTSPSGIGRLVSGWTTATSAPGMGNPTDPLTFGLVSPTSTSSGLAVMTGELSVSPHPLDTSTPTAS